MQATPQPDTAFQGAAHAGIDLRMAAAQLLQDSDGPQPRGGDENWHDLSLPHRFQRIGPAPTAKWLFLGGRPRILQGPVGGGRAETGFGGGLP